MKTTHKVNQHQLAFRYALTSPVNVLVGTQLHESMAR